MEIQYNLNDLIFEELSEKMEIAKIGVIVRGFLDNQQINVGRIVTQIANASQQTIYVSAVGYDFDAQSEYVQHGENVESAVAWRNMPECAGQIIVFVRDEAAKMHSLADFDLLTPRDIINRLLHDAQSDQAQNDPQKRFWQALQREPSLLQLDMLLEFANAVSASTDLDAIPDNLWRLGLLRDESVLQADRNPVDRLARNRSTLTDVEQLSNRSRQRMKSVLTKVEGQERVELQRAYQELMRFYKTGHRDILGELNVETVEQLIKSGKPKPKREVVEEKPNQTSANKTLQGRELDSRIAELVVGEDEESTSALRELGDAIREQRLNPQMATEDLSLEGQRVAIAPAPTKLTELIAFACTVSNWGGDLQTTHSELKIIVDAWQPGDFEPFTPDQDESLFDLLVRLERNYLESGVFSNLLEQLFEHREVLIQWLDLLVSYPLILFGGYPEVHEAADAYIEAYTKLLRAFRDNETLLHSKDKSVTQLVAGLLLRLDVIYVQTPTEWKAILTPLHPLHLWRYREIANYLREGGEGGFGPEERQQLAKALPDIPHLLHFIVVYGRAGGDNVFLPQSGNLGFLPTYENKTNRYLGSDGVDYLIKLLEQWLQYAPYSKRQLRIALIDIPDLSRAVSLLAKFLHGNPETQLIVSVYTTSGRDYQTELARLDYDNRHHDIAEAMQSGKLQIIAQEKREIATIVQDIKETPVHLTYAFDQAQPKMEKTQRARQLVVSPLVVSYEYEYSPILKRGTITPSSATEEGLFADYYFVVERASDLPANTELRLKFGEDVDISPFNELLSGGYTRWLAIADRVLTAYYAPEVGIPLSEKRLGQREVVVWALKSSRTATNFFKLLQRFNLRPDDDVVVDIIKRFGHIGSGGILSLPSPSGSRASRDAQSKGLLGTLLAAKWYTSVYPGSLVASLDTDFAKDWLQGRLIGNERADLIGVRVTEDDKIVVEPIEVKTRETLSADEVRPTRDPITNQRRLAGHAIEQLLSIINTLRPVFGEPDAQPLFTPARRESLKYQLYRECFREVHDETWRQAWYERLQDAFTEGRYQVVLSGLLLHIKLEQNIRRHVTVDQADPVRFVEIGVGEIQQLLSKTEVVLEGIEETSLHQTSSADDRVTTVVNETHEPSKEMPAVELEDNTNEKGFQPATRTSVHAELDEASHKEIRQLARAFLRSCESYRIQIEECDPDQARLGPNVWRLYIRLASGQSLKPLQTHIEDIGREMSRSGILISTIPNSDRIALDIPRLERKSVFLTDALPLLPQISSPEQLPILLGVTPEGDSIVRYLDHMPHLLVGGTTGSGKTVLLYSILVSLLRTHPNPHDLQLFMSSSGLEDFIFFNTLPHLVGGDVVADAARALDILNENIIPEFESRESRLADAHSRNIGEYNAGNQAPMPPLVLVIDEFADLSDQLTGDKAAKQRFHDNIRRVAQLGRKRGVHLVLCTQRPSADLVPTNIRSLLNARIALRVNDAIASRMILDEMGAEHLLSHGDMLFKEDAHMTRAQSYFVDSKQIKMLLRGTNSDS